MGKNKTFKNSWGNLTELGELFGFSAIKTGSQLKDMGFRNTDGSPSQTAIDQNLVLTVERGRFKKHLWNKHLLAPILKQAGMKQIWSASDRVFTEAQSVIKLMRMGASLENGVKINRQPWPMTKPFAQRALSLKTQSLESAWQLRYE